MAVDLVGISHVNAPVVVRERVALDRVGAARLSRELAANGAEAVCLSTCNRTELYVAHADAGVARALAEQPFADAGLTAVAYHRHDGAAARHLFNVAAGLDSMVLGEGQILGQVRTAHEAGAAGRVLHQLFRQAVHTGKKVREQTTIAQGAASVPAAATTVVRQFFGVLQSRRIVLVGAGKTSELTGRNLLAAGATVDVVANRTIDRGRELAAGLGAELLPLEGLRRELENADVIVSSTSAPGYVVSREDVVAALPARRGRPLLLIDLALPRDFDPGIRELDGCHLYDLDDLQAGVSETVTRRTAAAAEAEAIVSAEVAAFDAWLGSLGATPVVGALRDRAEAIRVAELTRAARSLSGLTVSQRRAVETLTSQIMSKFLHLPTVRLKEAADTTEGQLCAAATRHLFGLEP